MKSIQIFEHEKLTIHGDEFGRQISPTQLAKLCQFNDNNENKYYTVIRDGVKFCQYVGVIQIGNLTIEILPKADKSNNINKAKHCEQTNTWRKVLLRMLSITGEIKLETVSEAALRKRHNSILDLYFELYLKEIDALIKKGLVKKYRKEEGNVNALKGRLDFSKNIAKNLIHKERFYTHHQRYDYEHLINQILLKALNVLSGISYNPVIRDKINKLRYVFPEIQEIEINKNSFDHAHLNRKTDGYAEALKIAKMIILNYSPDISKGNENMLALLFDMNKLWEKYIFKMMKRGENNNYTVDYQQRKKFWEKRKVEPDIVLKMNNSQETYIIDTKWKIICRNNPSDDDLKQMYVYNMYWDACKSLLLYPMNDVKNDSDYGKFHKGRDKDNFCKVGFVSVLDEKNENLNMRIGEDIVGKL